MQSTQVRLQESLERIQLEESHEQAKRALYGKDLLIARTRHDIRQPNHSLRQALLAMSLQQGNPKTNEVMNRTLDHIEDMLEDYRLSDQTDKRISFATFGELTTQITAEFDQLAIERGVALKIVHSSIELPPLFH